MASIGTLETHFKHDEDFYQQNTGDKTNRSYNDQNGHANIGNHNEANSEINSQNTGFMKYREEDSGKSKNQKPAQQTTRSQNNQNQISKYTSEEDYQTHQNGTQKNQGLTMEYGKTIRLLRNGDEFYRGHKFVINSRKYRYFDVFMDDISDALNANFGAIRKIHTPTGGHRIRSLDELEDGKTYVAAGNSRFVKLK